MSISSTVLVFVVIPVAIVGIVAALVLSGGDKGRKSRRYRPGRPYDFAPIWYLAAPEQVSTAAGGHGQRPALAAAHPEDSHGERVLPGLTGGASDRW